MEAFADIDGPVRIGLLAILGIIALALLVASIIGSIIWMAWKKRGQSPSGPTLPQRSPLEIAMERLDRLQAQAAKMEADPFIVEVSDIVRDYLETALKIPAREQTSEEFLQELRKGEGLPAILIAKMPQFLDQCDLVKFARQLLADTERERLLETAGTVISDTDSVLHQGAGEEQLEREAG